MQSAALSLEPQLGAEVLRIQENDLKSLSKFMTDAHARPSLLNPAAGLAQITLGVAKSFELSEALIAGCEQGI
jgi:hypothetical protein